ncbi:pyridine nucleotide-disulfide oxidoreductase [Cooperia oncophora]
MEIAATLVETAAHMTVICDTTEPMLVLGTDVGTTVRKFFEKNGVRVLVNATTAWFVGADHVSGVQLLSGEIVPADVVVIGVGSRPPTDFLKDSNVQLDADGYIKVDSNFKVCNIFKNKLRIRCLFQTIETVVLS